MDTEIYQTREVHGKHIIMRRPCRLSQTDAQIEAQMHRQTTQTDQYMHLFCLTQKIMSSSGKSADLPYLRCWSGAAAC